MRSMHVIRSPLSARVEPLRISQDDVRRLVDVLDEGEVVRVRVVRALSEHKALVRVKGINVVAESEGVFPERGARLFLQVKARHPRIVLGMMDTYSGQQFTARLREGEIKSLLHELGLSSNERHMTVARHLFSYELPVTKENIRHVLSLYDMFGKNDIRNIEAITYLLARQLPVDQRSVYLIHAFLSGKPDVVQLLQQFDHLMSQPHEPILRSEVFANLMTSLRDLMLRFQQPEELAEQLRRLVKNHFSSIEGRWQQFIRSPSGEGGLGSLEEHIDVRMLRLLRHPLWQKALTSMMPSGDMKLFSESLAQVMDYSDSRQLANHSDAGSTKAYLLDLPVDIQGALRRILVEIQLDEEGHGKGSRQSKGHHIAFSLETSRLGSMRILIRMTSSGIEGEFSVETKEVQDFILARKKDLEEHLLQRGMSLGRLTCCVQPQEREDAPLQTLRKDIVRVDKVDVFI